ncbi:MAG: TfoX/Sxy family protein [Paracoccaceae bacterium]
MSLPDDTIAFVLELLEPIGALSTRNMMGGLCIYSEGQIFAILDSDGTLFLKAKGGFADRLQAAGSRQFGSDHGKRMGYWTLPEAALDDADVACDWARQALADL